MATDIGKMIFYLRKGNQLSRRELGERAGLSSKAIQRYETGENEPTIGSLSKIASALNITFIIHSDGKYYFE